MLDQARFCMSVSRGLTQASADLVQIDGLGGMHIATSKNGIISSPTSRDTDADVDVEYTFAQVGVDGDYVDYGANCRNSSCAVGVFRDEGGDVEPCGV